MAKYKEICVGGSLHGRMKPKNVSVDHNAFKISVHCNHPTDVSVVVHTETYYRHTCYMYAGEKVIFWANIPEADSAIMEFTQWLFFPLRIA